MGASNNGYCPKCKSYGMTSDLDFCGREVGYNPTKVDKCMICGYRVYPVQQVHMHLTAAQKAKNPYGRGMINEEKFELVRRYYSDIKGLREGKTPVSWYTIAGLVRQASGMKIQADAVERYFNRIEQGVLA